MADDLKFFVLFGGTDQLSGMLNHIGGGFDKVTKQVQTTSERWKATAARWHETGKSMMVAGAEMAAPGLAGAYLFKKLFDAGAEYAGELAHVKTAMADGAATQQHLNELQEFSDKLAMRGVIGTKQLADAYYIARSNGLDHAEALKAIAASTNLVTGTTANAEEAQAAMADTTRTLTGLHNIYHASLDQLSDSLSLLQTKYAFKNITEITDALKYVAPVAKNAGMGMDELAADIAILSQNMQIGGQSGETMRNILIAFQKGGTREALVPFQRMTAQGTLNLQASVQALHDYLAKMTPLAAAGFLTKAGFQARGLVGIQTLLTNLSATSAIRTDWTHSLGAGADAAKTRLAGADEQVSIFKNSLSVLAETLGTALLPTATAGIDQLTVAIRQMVEWTTAHMPEIKSAVKGVGDTIASVAGVLKSIITEMVRFGEAHPAIAQLALKMALIGPLISLAGGGAMIAGGGFVMLASGALKAVAGVASAVSWIGSFTTTAASVGSATAGVAESLGTIAPELTGIITSGEGLAAVAPELGGLGVAAEAAGAGFLAIAAPIAGVVAGIAAVGVGAYEMYEHWSAVKGFFSKLWADVKMIFSDVVTWMENAGWNMIKSFAAGIWKAASLPAEAAEAIAAKIGGFFHFHSPPAYGPLREAVLNFRLGEELAKHMRPLPVVTAAARTAAGAGATLQRGGGGGGVTINLHYAPVIQGGGSPQEWVQAARQHADELMRIIDSKLNRRERLRFA
jgi:TP901 family phage tail tape measure protein